MRTKSEIIEYFGTTLTDKGHFMRKIINGELDWKTSLNFDDLDFDPEKTPTMGMKRGDHSIFHTDKYTVYFICGSPIDMRSGCKSVFFLKGHYHYEEFISILNQNKFFNQVVSLLK